MSEAIDEPDNHSNNRGPVSYGKITAERFISPE
jgi:hypothetical protein